jgi:Lrp/AsnC family transcriptional regulator for asnA, asnC and gidA|tara:strand:+ start:3248 stop:3715 length:468 start_codon:yes stop_codon:yes gene_type:complete
MKRVRQFDELDMKILTELVKDGNASVPKLSKKIQANSSVVYSRIKRLFRRGVIERFTVEVNDEFFGYQVSALVGLNIDSKLRSEIVNEMLHMDRIIVAREVTGRFDLLVTCRAHSLEDLHNLVGKIGELTGIHHTETFVQMRRNVTAPAFQLASH